MKVLSSIFLFLLCISASAQDTEIGFFMGASNYLGDLNPDYSFKGIKPAASIFLRNNISERVAFKHSLLATELGFSDSYTKDVFQLQRNLSFRSRVYEVSSQFEFNFLHYVRGTQSHHRGFHFTPYLSIGVAGFYFNPQAHYNNQWIDLQPLGTEGQNDPSYTGRKKYSRFGFAIPIGGGFKWNMSKAWTLGFEISNRKTFTDYIDDVSTTYVKPISLPDVEKGLAYKLADRSGEVGSKIGKYGQQRGTSDKKDDYLVFGLSLSYTFVQTKCPFPSAFKYR